VVIGGGPTGVELAGAISDIAKLYMRHDFRHIDPANARVLILEGSPAILSAYPEDLQQSAIEQLKQLGVKVRLNAHVSDVQPGYVMIGDERIDSVVTLWAAGVQASPLGKLLGVETDRRGCVMVDQFLHPAGHPEMFVCGDLAHVEADDPDLSRFRDAGGKLILTHAANDQLILVDGSIGYYRRVIDVIGGEKATKEFARFFVSEGDGHCLCLHPGPGILAADAMAALMRWVEQGIAPDEILAKEIDVMSGDVLATRPVYAYPMVPQYRGKGDAKDAASFRPVHLSERGRSRE